MSRTDGRTKRCSGVMTRRETARIKVRNGCLLFVHGVWDEECNVGLEGRDFHTVLHVRGRDPVHPIVIFVHILRLGKPQRFSPKCDTFPTWAGRFSSTSLQLPGLSLIPNRYNSP